MAVPGATQPKAGPVGELPPIVIKFGGGINTRELVTDMQDAECADTSHNFKLDLFSAAFSPRAPFDLVGTAPNGKSIQGFAQVQKKDGTISTLIQAGDLLYRWDGNTFATIVNVPPTSRLRGRYDANYPLLNQVMITDLTLQYPVSTWDGTNFAPLATNLGTTFYAKYCIVSQERAWFANVIAGTATPHMIVASAAGDPTNLTIANKPTLALGIGDPFFVLTQDLSPVNGFAEFLTDKYVSTERGSLNFIHGIDSRDITIDQKYPFIGALGDEALVYIGNDIAYGRNGRVETMFGTINYGDIETQELSRHIANKLAGVNFWTLVYDPLLYRLYCFPKGQSVCWTYYKSITDDWVNRYYRRDGLPIRSSSWSPWTTVHPIAFQPSCAWMMKRPSDGKLGVYMGDTLGNIYWMDGSGPGDGGSAPITTSRLSKMYQLPDGEVFDVDGYVTYQQQVDSDAILELTIQHNGIAIWDQPVQLNALAQANQNASYFSDTAYFGGGSYFGVSFAGRVARNRFGFAGRSSEFQILASVTCAEFFAINDITLKIKAAK